MSDLFKKMGVTVGDARLINSTPTRPVQKSLDVGFDVGRHGTDPSFRERLDKSLGSSFDPYRSLGIKKAYGDESLKDSHGENWHKDNDKQVKKLNETAEEIDPETDADKQEKKIRAIPTQAISRSLSREELFLKSLIEKGGRPFPRMRAGGRAPAQPKDPAQAKQGRAVRRELLGKWAKKAEPTLEVNVEKGKTPVGKKISKLVRQEGVPQKQAVATALNMERRGRLTSAGEYVHVKKKSELDEVCDLIKGVTHEPTIVEQITEYSDVLKSLFYEPGMKMEEVKYVPTKDDLLNQLKWKFDELKRLKEAAWVIQEETPDAKELALKIFAGLKREIAEIVDKHGKAKKSEVLDFLKAEGGDKIIEMVPEKPVKNLAKLHENSPGMNPRNAMAKKKADAALYSKKSFVKSAGPGGIVMDFGRMTGNPIADRATALLNQFADPVQEANAKYHEDSFGKAISDWAEKGEAKFAGEATPFGNIDKGWSKQLDKPMDQQVVEAFNDGALEENRAAPAVKNQFNKSEINLGGMNIKATSETDAALIEMMKAEQAMTQGDDGFVADASHGGRIEITAGE